MIITGPDYLLGHVGRKIQGPVNEKGMDINVSSYFRGPCNSTTTFTVNNDINNKKNIVFVHPPRLTEH